MRINIYNNVLEGQAPTNLNLSVGTLFVQGINIIGSLSFNNIVLLKSAGNNAQTQTISFGLYSLNVSTLSLANSASQTNTMANGLSFVSLVTSATQDITPGYWYFALLSSSAGANSGSLQGHNMPVGQSLGQYGGHFMYGHLSVTTSALPESIASTDLIKAGNTSFNNIRRPYIIISS